MATKNPGKVVNRAGLAECLGVVLPTVDGWVKRGCPVIERGGRGKEWRFGTADVARWLRDQAVSDATGDTQADEAEIERRTKKAKMLVAELELAKARGEVAPVDEFKRVQASRYAMIRANVLNIPTRAVLQLLGETDEATFKKKLRAEIVLALDTAANAPLDISDDDAVEEDAEE